MKTAIQFGLWGLAVAAVVYVAVGAETGVLYNNPLACVGVGLIGLGLCRHAAEANARGQKA